MPGSRTGAESGGKDRKAGGEIAFPVVGMGASAGGLEALEQFFDETPPDGGMAYVVVTHQSSGRPSLLPELLAKHTKMAVRAVSGPTPIERDHVYLAPAGSNLEIRDRTLVPVEPDSPSSARLPIDAFFRSLAEVERERAIGIVLSGTGTDGTLGLKAIKGEAGMVMAQDEGSARFGGMPRSAIATSLVDFVLPAAELPKQLLAYVRGSYVHGGGTPADGQGLSPALLRDVLGVLRSRTGQDFGAYKRSTIGRRIERRVSLLRLESAAEYVQVLRADPAEVDRLFRDLLIGVTSFFRDPEVFERLAEDVLPELLAKRSADDPFRAWVPGCSSGEEAYSIAILLREALDAAKRHADVQVFATDLDEASIQEARRGVFPGGIAADVGPKRLERFFTRDGEALRVRKEIRETLVFARHDVLDDPPFTRLDLLSCRNLLIYLESKVQKRLLPVFHHALRPGGILLLGSSESVGSAGHLFRAADKKARIFLRHEGPTGSYPAGRRHRVAPDTDLYAAESGAPGKPSDGPGFGPIAHRVLLDELCPPSLLVHESGEIVHVHGRTGRYLELAPGSPSPANAFTLAREGLPAALASAIRRAARPGDEVVEEGVRVRTNGDHVEIDLRVKRLAAPDAARGLFLVTFRDPRPSAPAPPPSPRSDSTGGREREERIEEELRFMKEIHQTAVDRLETANEELQSTVEELQSVNEELETSKEELQSLNEELQTVNEELQENVEELSRTNDDMRNLLNGTQIATIFLDGGLRIRRYTERAKRIVRLIPSDVGRPLGDLVSRLRYDRFLDDASEVLETLALKEVEVEGEEGEWYLMRILPYRTNENAIDGLVVTFVDISKSKALQDIERQLVRTLESSPTSVFRMDEELRYRWVYGSVLGRGPAELEGRTDLEAFPDEAGRTLHEIKRRALATGEEVRSDVEMRHEGQDVVYDLSLAPFRREDGRPGGLTGVSTDVSKRILLAEDPT